MEKGGLPTVETAKPSTSQLDSDADAISKKKQKKLKRVNQKIKLADGSVDVRVQHTNDDSVVSKRSAISHGYLADNFLRHFVRKPSRRSPLINRGYYLRMAVVTEVITQLADFYAALEQGEKAANVIQVISLGAGFDTLAMRLLLSDAVGETKGKPHLKRALVSGAVECYDVDFPAVMQAKASLMQATPAGTFPSSWDISPGQADCPVSSPHYRALGVDLREAEACLATHLQTHGAENFSVHHPTIVYAECVMQYMPPEDAAKLVRVIANTFSNVAFLAYDQLCPNDTFGHLMQSSLRQKNSPLLGIQAMKSGMDTVRRSLTCAPGVVGDAWFADFHAIAQYCVRAGGEERARVDALEDFDELEEWAEMCEHYGLTLTTTSSRCDAMQQMIVTSLPFFKNSTQVLGETPIINAGKEAKPIAGRLVPWPTSRFGFEGWGNGATLAEPLPNGDTLFVSFGGFTAAKMHQRTDAICVHSLQQGELQVVATAAAEHAPPALIFHSFTRLSAGKYLVWGGRTNPSAPSNEAFILSLQLPRGIDAVAPSSVIAQWTPLSVAGLVVPSPRFRHTMVALPQGEREASGCGGGVRMQDTDSLLLFGGQGKGSSYPEDCYMVRINTAERTITYEEICFSTPLPSLRSCAAVALGSDHVVVSGGLLKNDRCHKQLLHLYPRAKTIKSVFLPVAARFSHTMVHLMVQGQESLFILGGSLDEAKGETPLAVVVRVEAPGEVSSWSPVRWGDAEGPAPWWSRHSCTPLFNVAQKNGVAEDGVVAVTGGGYTCFSFGTFTAKPYLIKLGGATTTPGEEAVSATSLLAPLRPALASPTAPPQGVESGFLLVDWLLSKPWAQVPEVRHYTKEEFLRVAAAAKSPVIFRQCLTCEAVQSWASADRLASLEKDTMVSVHVASGSCVLDFVRKNFTFRHVPFSELVQHVNEAGQGYRENGSLPAETWYYRSIAARMKTERSDIWADFPTLAADFELPPGAKEYVMPRVHQSCLRMNAPPLQLWTHYDTLDNVLCQVVGRKRVVLFPPSQYGNLYMDGSSSRVLQIDQPDIRQYPRFLDACKTAMEVELQPGDMLYFPAMWFHHITTLPSGAGKDEHNISVNVFFKHFEDDAVYDAKDLYGNKDIPAVCRLRDGIAASAKELMAKSSLSAPGEGSHARQEGKVPPEYLEFALRQGIQDLETVANGMAAQREAERISPS